MADSAASTPQQADPPPRKRRPSLGQMVFLALVAGLAAGVFFGDLTLEIQFIGEIYVGLLQMMVLPYIILALVNGVGQLTPSQAGRLAKCAALVLLLMWGAILSLVVLLPLALPPLETAGFFSSSLVTDPAPVSLIELFIPSNVFASLSESHVPAIVLFALAIGAALIATNDKQEILKLCDILIDVFMRVIDFVVRLTPIGVFVMTAVAAGTMDFDDLGRLQAYFIITGVAAALLAFWVLPGLIASLTPFTFRQALTAAWPAIVLAFAVEQALVAIPVLVEGIRGLFEKNGVEDEQTIEVAEMLVPVSFPLPNTGKLLILLFVPFAAWFVGQPMGLDRYPMLLSFGVPTFFGDIPIALPFMLDVMQLPSDLFQLFLITAVLCGRLSDGLLAMDMFTFSVLVACGAVGLWRVRVRALLLYLGVAAGVVAIATLGARAYLGRLSTGAYDRDKVIASMQLVHEIVESEVVEPAPNPVPLRENLSRLERIQERGVIRVGFNPDRLPFSFFNAEGQLVGFDIDVAQELAAELGVEIEFVPFSFDSIFEQLEADHFDIAMAGIYAEVDQAESVYSSIPYMFATMALVVPDHRDEEFASEQALRQADRVTLAIDRNAFGRSGAIERIAERDYPNVQIVVLDDTRDFFERQGGGAEADALLLSAEAGSAWTLLYPSYKVVTTWGGGVAVPLVYLIAGRGNTMGEAIDDFIVIAQSAGIVQRAYDYWILGQGAEVEAPRWSIIRDVLRWTD